MKLRPRRLALSRAAYGAAVLLACAGLSRALSFTLSTGSAPWFDASLEIDGGSYIRGMRSASRGGNILNLDDLYHSPGYQVYLGCLGGVFSDEGRVFRAIKLLNWIAHVLCVAGVLLIGEKFVSAGSGAVGAVLLAFSPEYQYYANLVQYEVILGLLLLACALLWIWWRPGRSLKIRYGGPVVLGALVSAICLIQPRYLPIAPAILCGLHWKFRDAAADVRPSRSSCLLSFVLTAAILLGGWCAYQSLRFGELILISRGSSWRFHEGNNLNARGFAFPYLPIADGSGWRFVIAHPLRWLWLVGRRALFFFGLKRDVWSLGSRSAPAAALSLAGFGAGMWMKFRADGGRAFMDAALPVLLVFLSGAVGPLLVFASPRFLVPEIPLMAVFQGYAVASLARYATRKTFPL